MTTEFKQKHPHARRPDGTTRRDAAKVDMRFANTTIKTSQSRRISREDRIHQRKYSASHRQAMTVEDIRIEIECSAIDIELECIDLAIAALEEAIEHERNYLDLLMLNWRT